MTVEVLREADVMGEAAQILLQHLSPAKAARFWASWHTGQGDYLKWRDEVFVHQSIDQLYEQILVHQQQMADSSGVGP